MVVAGMLETIQELQASQANSLEGEYVKSPHLH